MTDWNALAAARNLDIPPAEITKIAPALDALEEAFRPLVNDLPVAYTESE